MRSFRFFSRGNLEEIYLDIKVGLKDIALMVRFFTVQRK